MAIDNILGEISLIYLLEFHYPKDRHSHPYFYFLNQSLLREKKCHILLFKQWMKNTTKNYESQLANCEYASLIYVRAFGQSQYKDRSPYEPSLILYFLVESGG